MLLRIFDSLDSLSAASPLVMDMSAFTAFSQVGDCSAAYINYLIGLLALSH